MNKKELRPNIPSAKVDDTMSTEEQFQNLVIRPIIKLQHNTIIALFDNYLEHSDFDIHKFDTLKKLEFLKTVASRNQHLRNQYVGIIIGMFTDEEFAVYLTNMGEYSKRIMQIISQRIQDTY
ncbi:hypothetical protein FHR24_002091 [Wenyingzhuangia heitensis]|uniref:Glyoxalase n=1 Tax=Wenyingzhuangia heitensis TaxID=1487859 RepID=A0ABX0UA50_9FLAO|nr:glyoxalase [Wenyingzhuangia heitensis]NIJ45623.1 hypothetical protein [Wenyingzhuangia heitensis]